MGEGAGGSVLHVDDDPGRATRIAGRLGVHDLAVSTETDPDEAVQCLESEPFDCVVLACENGPQAVDTVTRIRETRPDLPVVALAGNPADASAAVDAGATDYVLSEVADEHPDLLAARVWDAVERGRARLAPEGERGRGEEFARLVAHDLRNPMTVARGWVEVLHHEGGEVPFRKAVDAIDRMDDILDNLEGLARGDPADDERVELSAVATAAWELADTGDADLRVEYGQEVRADPSLLQEALENLFANAAEHGGDDVTVRVGATGSGPSDGPRDGAVVGTDDSTGGFYVSDDGAGIAPADRERVFESGYADGGTGLGLAIVRRIAETHGWEVTAGESAEGGARFEFSDVSVDPPSRPEAVPD